MLAQRVSIVGEKTFGTAREVNLSELTIFPGKVGSSGNESSASSSESSSLF